MGKKGELKTERVGIGLFRDGTEGMSEGGSFRSQGDEDVGRKRNWETGDKRGERKKKGSASYPTSSESLPKPEFGGARMRKSQNLEEK